MARNGYGLPNVSLGPAMPDPSTPFGRATLETTLRPFQGWPARRAGGLGPSSTPLDTPRPTPLHPGFRRRMFEMMHYGLICLRFRGN
jgi:hypothetical protein